MMVRRTGTAPTRFQVLGERSSGTNFVKRLVGRNTDLQPTEALGWKHGFAQSMAVPADLAVICVVRNAADWALSMHAKPWHAVPELQSMAFSEFIRAPWQTIIDRPRYFNDSAGLVGQPLQQDRHPLTGAMFESIFALRQAKLTSLLGYLRRDCTCIVLRMEDMQAAPESRLDQLRAALGQPPRDTPFRAVHRRLGSKFKPAIASRPATPDQISPQDLSYLQAQIDPVQESQLDYEYS